LLGFNDDKGKVFEIAIQFAAILAVVWEYRVRLWHTLLSVTSDPVSKKLAINLGVAFLPAAILGFVFLKQIKAYLFNPLVVASAFIIGGLLILWAERRNHRVHVETVDDLTWIDALKVGFAQALAMIPGTSRSGATIIGGLFFGLSRRAATEFSFFLAIPTMLAATSYDIFKHRDLFSSEDIPLFAVGGTVSFISAFIAVRGLLRFISRHDFAIFAWYRIAFGVVVLLTAQMGWVEWNEN
jgi:undecaprenyl-diphosphatase